MMIMIINTMCKKKVFKFNIQDCSKWQKWQEYEETQKSSSLCFMAFLLESCTALCKSVEWYKGNYRGINSELHFAVK